MYNNITNNIHNLSKFSFLTYLHELHSLKRGAFLRSKLINIILYNLLTYLKIHVTIYSRGEGKHHINRKGKKMKFEIMYPVATIFSEDGRMITLSVFSNDETGLFDVIGTIPDSDPDEPDEWEIIAERFESRWEAEEAIKLMYDNGNWGIEYL